MIETKAWEQKKEGRNKKNQKTECINEEKKKRMDKELENRMHMRRKEKTMNRNINYELNGN